MVGKLHRKQFIYWKKKFGRPNPKFSNFPTTISKQVESTHGIFKTKLVHNHNGNHPYKNWQPLLGRHNQVWM